MSELVSTLKAEFADRDYAHSYIESHLVSRIAAQIHSLRKQRNWSQKELAAHAGIAQEQVSKIENGDFESITTRTLHKLSRAFDVVLHVELRSFSKEILDVVLLEPSDLLVTSREIDLAEFQPALQPLFFSTIRAVKTTGNAPTQMVDTVINNDWLELNRATA